MDTAPRIRTLEDAQRLNRALDAVLPTIAALVVWGLGRASPASAIALAALATLLWRGAARVLRPYDANGGRGFRGDIALTVVLVAAMLVPTWLAAALPQFPATTAQAWSFALFLAPSVVAVRLALVGPFLWAARQPEEVLICGIGPLGRMTGNEIHADARRTVVGYLRFADETPHERLHAPLLGTVDALEETLRTRVVDEVWVASTAPEHAASVQQAVRVCETLGVPFALPLVTYRMARAQPIVASSMADGYVHYHSVRRKPVQQALKRALDIAASAGALVALAPLLLATAAAVQLTSRGPVLFRQQRVGLNGRIFSMLKFRSMVADAESLKAALAAENERTG
ncbi:MAG TPA: sugar transferase, partial [Polyangiaceae bacterium]